MELSWLIKNTKDLRILRKTDLYGLKQAFAKEKIRFQ